MDNLSIDFHYRQAKTGVADMDAHFGMCQRGLAKMLAHGISQLTKISSGQVEQF